MHVTKQGEKLLLLVRRDRRTTEELATAMAIDKSYLPKLYKMDILPPKPLRKALEIFQVPESYFLESAGEVTVVAEPDHTYPQVDATDPTWQQLRTEIKTLRAEMQQLKKMLEQERATNANLAEALKNLSKR